jgi:Domain of unknown function (DUF5127)/Domain of unknown function (DUF4964)
MGDSVSKSQVALWVEVLLCVLSAGATIQYNPIKPPSYPLAVRNPYLSTWLPGNLVANLPFSSPQFWYGNNLTWAVIGRVDGVAYGLMGLSDSSANISAAQVQSAEYTSTHSIFTLVAGDVAFTLDFLSPVSPWNYLRQSLPFSRNTFTHKGNQG